MVTGPLIGSLVMLLVISILTRQSALFFLTLALLVAFWLSKVWRERCLEHVEFRRRFLEHDTQRGAELDLKMPRVSFGEAVELELEVVNRKLLPLSWLEIEDETPREIIPRQLGRTGGRTLFKPGRALLSALFALRPYERVRRRYIIDCKTRGEHVFGPVSLRTGDLFGFVTREEELDYTQVLVVYPQIMAVEDMGLSARQPLGDLRVRSWLFEDPTRIAGARDYRPSDGLRRVHWAATARTGALQSKVYEATTSHKLILFLNLATDADSWWNQDVDVPLVEMTITACASVAVWALERGYSVGLYTNGVHRGSFGHVVVEAQSDPSQLERILQALGRLQQFAGRPLAEMTRIESRRLPYGATTVIFSGVLGDDLAESALSLRRAGHAISLIYTGRDESASLPGIPTRFVGPPEAYYPYNLPPDSPENPNNLGIPREQTAPDVVEPVGGESTNAIR